MQVWLLTHSLATAYSPALRVRDARVARILASIRQIKEAQPFYLRRPVDGARWILHQCR